jgi:hypothetical protein
MFRVTMFWLMRTGIAKLQTLEWVDSKPWLKQCRVLELHNGQLLKYVLCVSLGTHSHGEKERERSRERERERERKISYCLQTSWISHIDGLSFEDIERRKLRWNGRCVVVWSRVLGVSNTRSDVFVLFLFFLSVICSLFFAFTLWQWSLWWFRLPFLVFPHFELFRWLHIRM